MADFDWRTFLTQWSVAILAAPDAAHAGLPPDTVASGWLGFDGATEAQIAASEARLDVTLPPSYRAFLAASNGWRHTGGPVGRILAVQEIDRAGKLLPDLVAAWMAGWTMGQGDNMDNGAAPEDAVDYRHLDQALVLSALEGSDDALLLLNPAVRSDSGEWDAWFFASWVPGAVRYPSFEALLRSEYDAWIAASQAEAQRFTPEDTPDIAAARLPDLIRALEQKAAQQRHMAEKQQGMTVGYESGVAEGLDEITGALRELHDTAAQPAALREKLRDVALAFE